MSCHQLQFDFRSEEEKQAQEKRVKDIVSKFDSNEYYRINKWADWWCDRVPRCIGYGVYDLYSDTKNFLKHRYQLWRYGASDFECWSLSNHLAKHILVKLKHFKKMNRYGVPCFETNDGDVKYLGDAEKDSEKWEHILDEMIWTFDYIVDDQKYNPFPDFDYMWLDREKGFFNREKTEEEKKQFNDYMEKSKLLNERKQNGLKLFAEHFDSLWD